VAELPNYQLFRVVDENKPVSLVLSDKLEDSPKQELRPLNEKTHTAIEQKGIWGTH
jgi:hypothetical protein